MKSLKRYTSLILLSIMCCTAFAGSTFLDTNNSPKREMRAVWLTTFQSLDWPKTKAKDEWSRAMQQQELIDMLNLLQLANINTVIFQARTRGLVAYPSEIEEWDDVWTGQIGQSPGYDPLQFVIDECHKRAMEVQAWIVCIPPARGYRNPNHPSTATYLASIAEEITRKYDVDGINLDYIRYPENKSKGVSNSVGRENITRIVRAIHDRVKAVKPWVKMSCSPIGKYRDTRTLRTRGWNAYDKGAQDVERWTQEGLMDQIFPMMYWKDKNFDPYLPQWMEIANGKLIAPGLGIYFLHPKEGNWPLDVLRHQYNLLRHNAGMGYALFRTKFLTDNTKGLYFLTCEQNPHPALVPQIQGGKKPEPPKGVKVIYQKTRTEIRWNFPERNQYVNVYASRKYPVDVDNPQNIVALRLSTNGITLPKSDRLHYAFTTIDRYGNESNEISTPKEKSRPALPDRLRNR